MKASATVKPWQREYFSPGYKIAFLNAINLRLQGGESIGRALRSVVSAERNPAKQRDMAPALEALDQGEPVSQALSRLGFFDSTVLAILHAGERSGMRDAIASAAAHLTVKHEWLRNNALVMFVLANEMLSAVLAPIALHVQILPWVRQHITTPTDPVALANYRADMAVAEQLTLAMIALTAVLGGLAVFHIYRISRLSAPTRILLFFSDGAMGVGFKLAAAMLKAGVTIENVARDLSIQAPGWSRRYWESVHHRLQQAVEPSQALLQPGIYAEERSLFASHTNARQLADTLLVLSGGREQRAKRARDLLLIGATMLTITYIVMTMGMAVWIYMTYDDTLSAGLEALSRGF